MRRRRLLSACAGGVAASLGGCSSLSGRIRELTFAEVRNRTVDGRVRVTAEVMTTINVEGDAGDFHEVVVLGYSCATDGLVCRKPVGTVGREATREDPVVVTMECDRTPDMLTLDAKDGPCAGTGTFEIAVLNDDEWAVGAFERECGELLPPERVCRVAVGTTTN